MNNEDRICEYGAFLSYTDFVQDGDRIYCANNNYNLLLTLNEKGEVQSFVPFEEIEASRRNMHIQCVKWQNKIIFLPAGNQPVHVYEPESKKQQVYRLAEGTRGSLLSWKAHKYEERLYLLPCYQNQGLWRWDNENGGFIREEWWEEKIEENKLLQHISIDEKQVATWHVGGDKLYITNLSSREVEVMSFPDECIHLLQYDGQNFWYTINKSADIVCWNRQGVVKRICLPVKQECQNRNAVYLGMYCVEDKVFLGDGDYIYLLNKKKNMLECLYAIKFTKGVFAVKGKRLYFKHIGSKLICMLRYAGEIIVIDLVSGDVKQYSQPLYINPEMDEYRNRVLLDRGALLFEEKGVVDLDMLIRYCT